MAVANPRHISMDLVNAQQARRALDYLVGFTLSPFTVEKGTARFVSRSCTKAPALRLIVEREEAIEALQQTQEYWTITANTKA